MAFTFFINNNGKMFIRKFTYLDNETQPFPNHDIYHL